MDCSNKSRLEDAFLSVATLVTMDDVYSGTTQMRALVRLFTSGLINMFTSALTVAPASPGQPTVLIDQALQDQVTMLKELTWHYVIERPSLASQQYGQTRVINGLFEIYSEAARIPNKRALLPPGHQERLENAEKANHQTVHGELQQRTAADIVAGLTEHQAVQLFQRLAGVSIGSILDRIVS